MSQLHNFLSFSPPKGNVKQVLTIVLSVIIFNLRITPLNGVGILLTLAGGAWYT